MKPRLTSRLRADYNTYQFVREWRARGEFGDVAYFTAWRSSPAEAHQEFDQASKDFEQMMEVADFLAKFPEADAPAPIGQWRKDAP